MLQTLSDLKIIDNSGGREAHCIKVLKNKKCASLGDTIVVSLRKVTKLPKKNTFKARKVTVGKVYRVFVIQTKKEISRFDGSTIKFSTNAGILLNRQGQPIGTRVKGSLPNELRSFECIRSMSLGPNLI